ncbi:MAG: formylglycine-generating enzyme family protein [Spirochaetaceae bacterium]|jgi:formylglycine-generating enzyme required for sulfatase activity|nr:formylglycine-generating enzyme family protein [Spirochaetaceae bacterium]
MKRKLFLKGMCGSTLLSNTLLSAVLAFAVMAVGCATKVVEIESEYAGTLVLIEAGTFDMGSPESEEGHTSDETLHKVRLTNDFYMGKYEITQGQYEALMGSNPSHFQVESRGYTAGEVQENRPVESVSWYDAIVFCNTLSMMEGLTPAYSKGGETDPGKWGAVPKKSDNEWNAITCDFDASGYRLPTEAEWEYACRAGTDKMYNTEDAINTIDWYRDNSNQMTHEVGLKTANAYGVCDMYGNVSEWCWDWFGELQGETQTNPTGSPTGAGRIFRGGDWFTVAEYLRSADRNFNSAFFKDGDTGFRVVRPWSS